MKTSPFKSGRCKRCQSAFLFVPWKHIADRMLCGRCTAEDHKACLALSPDYMAEAAPILQFIYDCRLMDGIAAG